MITTTTLETSRLLKEAGFPQRNCAFYHYFNAGKPVGAIVYGDGYRDVDDDFLDSKLLAAPTAEEILEKLPKEINFPDDYFAMTIQPIRVGKNKNKWGIVYESSKMGIDEFGKAFIAHNISFHSEIEDSLAEAAAKMYLYLKKEGLIK